MARKTVTVARIVETANRVLASEEPWFDDAYRNGVIGMTEAMLFAADAYRGFRFLPTETGPDGRLLPNYNTTRRAYYVE